MIYKNEKKVGMDICGNLCSGEFVCNLCGEEIRKNAYLTNEEFVNKYANYEEQIDDAYLQDLYMHLLKAHGKEIKDGVDKWDGKERVIVLREMDKWDLITDKNGDLDIGAYELEMRDKRSGDIVLATNVAPEDFTKLMQKLVHDKKLKPKNIRISLNRECFYCIVYKEDERI